MEDETKSLLGECKSSSLSLVSPYKYRDFHDPNRQTVKHVQDYHILRPERRLRTGHRSLL